MHDSISKHVNFDNTELLNEVLNVQECDAADA